MCSQRRLKVTQIRGFGEPVVSPRLVLQPYLPIFQLASRQYRCFMAVVTQLRSVTRKWKWVITEELEHDIPQPMCLIRIGKNCLQAPSPGPYSVCPDHSCSALALRVYLPHKTGCQPLRGRDLAAIERRPSCCSIIDILVLGTTLVLHTQDWNRAPSVVWLQIPCYPKQANSCYETREL